jgi:hypothetical protein
MAPWINPIEEQRNHKERYFLQTRQTPVSASTIVPRGTIWAAQGRLCLDSLP